jgi:hypothetical protein
VTPRKLVALSLSPQQFFFAWFVDNGEDGSDNVACDGILTKDYREGMHGLLH